MFAHLAFGICLIQSRGFTRCLYFTAEVLVVDSFGLPDLFAVFFFLVLTLPFSCLFVLSLHFALFFRFFMKDNNKKSDNGDA